MSGLGIVIEEKEPPPVSVDLRDKKDDFSRIVEHEILLPPLPDTNLQTSPSRSQMHSPMREEPEEQLEHIDELHESINSLDDQDTAQRLVPYKLDSPKLKIHSFPALTSNPSSTTTVTSNSTLKQHSQNSSSFPNLATLFSQPLLLSGISSPLRNLKSGIRKLSLGSSAPSRPSLNPIQTSLGNMSLTASNSPVTSTPSYRAPEKVVNNQADTRDASYKRHSHNSSHLSMSTSDTSSICSMNTTAATSSSACKVAKRSRTPSNPLLTPLTPPLTSPVITLLENLSSTKKTLSEIENAYFETLNSQLLNGVNERNALLSLESSEGSAQLMHHHGRGRVSSITEMSSSADLINYSTFLLQQKKSFTEAFELAKLHLMQSGWCSEHDLNNLLLQQDTQVAQIDTKLLQIEEKLNRDYGVSLQSKYASVTPTATNLRVKELAEHRTSASPSLKVLESRCISYTGL